MHLPSESSLWLGDGGAFGCYVRGAADEVLLAIDNGDLCGSSRISYDDVVERWITKTTWSK